MARQEPANHRSDSFMNRLPPGYTLSLRSGTDSTQSGIQGPGRMVGSFFSLAGKRVEKFVDRFAEQNLGLGPNKAAQRLLVELHNLHVVDPSGKGLRCSSEYVQQGTNDITNLLEKLVWVCNGLCAECNQPYLPALIAKPMEPISKAITQLANYLTDSELSNIHLATIYVNMLAVSRLFPLLPDHPIVMILRSKISGSIDNLYHNHWLKVTPPKETVDLLQEALICLLSNDDRTDAGTVGVHLQASDRFNINSGLGEIDGTPLVAQLEDSIVKARKSGFTIATQIYIIQLLTSIRCVRPPHTGILSEQLLMFIAELSVCPNLFQVLEVHIEQCRIHVVSELMSVSVSVVEGHSSQVLFVAFLPGNSQIASASSDGTIRLLDISTRQPTTSRASYWLSAATLSPDGTRLALGMNDRSVHIWDLLSQRSIGVLKGHRNWVASLAFSSDGSQLVTGSYDSSIRIWNLHRPEESAVVLNGHTAGITSIAFSYDATVVISGSSDASLRLWDTQTHKQTFVFESNARVVKCLSFSPDSASIAAGTIEGTIKIWNVETKQIRHVLTGLSGWVRCLSFSPDNRYLASSSGENAVEIWDPDSGHQLAVLRGHSDEVHCIAFSRSGDRIVSGSRDTTVRVWSMNVLTRSLAPSV